MRTLYIDADTVLYSSASQEQKLKCMAIHKASKREKLFESKTLFNKWVETTKWSKSDFDFVVVQELTGEPRFAFQNIKRKLENIIKAAGCDDYVICIQGKGNHRDTYETPFVQYKGQRPAKPLLYEQCFEFVLKKWKDKVLVSSGEETDDVVCQKAWQSYRQAHDAKSKDSATCVIAYVDKDIQANCPGWLLNYNRLEEKVFWNSPMEQAKGFWVQTLMGDAADNIPGLTVLSEATKIKYGIRTNGVGKITAAKILNNCTTEKEMIECVLECYREAHPIDALQRLQDNCYFLYLKRTPDDEFDLGTYCAKRGVIL